MSLRVLKQILRFGAIPGTRSHSCVLRDSCVVTGAESRWQMTASRPACKGTSGRKRTRFACLCQTRRLTKRHVAPDPQFTPDLPVLWFSSHPQRSLALLCAALVRPVSPIFTLAVMHLGMSLKHSTAPERHGVVYLASGRPLRRGRSAGRKPSARLLTQQKRGR